jgi:hypothetical protein
MKNKYLKPSREAIAKAKKIPGLKSTLEIVLAAELIEWSWSQNAIDHHQN